MFWLALLIVIYSYLEAQFIKVRRNKVPLDNLPPSFDGFTIIHISDLHSSRFGVREKRLCRILRQTEGDMVVFTGDYKLRKTTNEQKVTEILRQIAGCTRPRFGMLGVLGNSDNEEMVEGIEKAGIEILSGGVKKLTLGEGNLWIAGIGDSPLLEATRALLSVTSLLPRDSRGFKILLSHSPDVMPLAGALGYALVLCGDTHGGQIRLPFIGPLVVKSEISRRYCWGIIREGSTVLCVSSGLGTRTFPLRLLCPPEVRVLTLVAKSDSLIKKKSSPQRPQRSQRFAHHHLAVLSLLGELSVLCG